MKLTIFNLQEGKTYNAYHNGSSLARKFRVKNGTLENDGMGRFAPCDWAPMNASTTFSETKSTQGVVGYLLNQVSKALMLNFFKRGLTLLQLKEGVVYKSTNSKLPYSVSLENNELVNFETKEPVRLAKLSLSTRFFVLSDKPSLPYRENKNQVKTVTYKEKEPTR